jgi:flagellar hook-associated protein 2
MQFERAPVTKLQARQATYDAAAKAWDDLAARISSLRTAAEGIDTTGELSLFKAVSSDAAVVTATAGAGATPGPVTLAVESLAAANQVMAGFASRTTTVGAGTAIIAAGLASIGATAVSADGSFTAGAHTISVTRSGADLLVSLDGGAAVNVAAGSPVILTGSTGTLTVTFGPAPAEGTTKLSVVRTASGATVTDLASAIAAAGGPATAQVLDLGAGAGTEPPTKLILTATQTGTPGALTVDLSGFPGLDNTSLSELRPAADARVRLGTLTAVRPSNSISDLVPGVTLNLATVSPPGSDVTISVGTDADAVVTKVKSLVDALNGVRSTIAKYASYDADKKIGGVLLSDGNVRSLTTSLGVTTGQLLPSGTYRTLSQMGVSLGRDGTYQFDESKLRAALGADQPGVVTAAGALAKAIAGWAKDSDGTTGVASRGKAAAVAQSKDYGSQIDNYNRILEQREARYRAQFSKLETVLGQLRDQSNWLAGQIASLG